MLDIIKNIISEQLGIEDEVTPESKLADDLGIDSLLALQLSVLLEGQYDIEITEEELAQLTTVQDVIELLEAKGVRPE